MNVRLMSIWLAMQLRAFIFLLNQMVIHSVDTTISRKTLIPFKEFADLCEPGSVILIRNGYIDMSQVEGNVGMWGWGSVWGERISKCIVSVCGKGGRLESGGASGESWGE